MNLRSIAPVLLLCLLLAGCGAAEREEETGRAGIARRG